MNKEKLVYSFHEGDASMRNLLGGKGANLAEMTRFGLPVPPGFTITTAACNNYFKSGNCLSAQLRQQADAALKELELAKGRQFGDSALPLLISVRSGSVASMPGMMDTILNVGLNDRTVEGLAELTGNPRFAYDCYRRLIQMFGNVVMGIESIYYEKLLHRYKKKHQFEFDHELSADDWKIVIKEFKRCTETNAGMPFPQDVREQLRQAIEAVFRSWNNSRAKIYRKANQIPDSQGTAVNIQSMVFGNMGNDCGTGVVFTRNPSTGENRFYGEYLVNAQGEDVVAGIRTPLPIADMEHGNPAIYQELQRVGKLLENHYKLQPKLVWRMWLRNHAPKNRRFESIAKTITIGMYTVQGGCRPSNLHPANWISCIL